MHALPPPRQVFGWLLPVAMAAALLAAGLSLSGLAADSPSRAADAAGLLGASGIAWASSDVRVSDVSTTYPGPEKRLFEPVIAFDPTDPRALLAFGIDHSTQNVDARIWSVDRAYRSTDGGATWTDHGPMADEGWDGGDPVIFFDELGAAYFTELSSWRAGGERVGGILLHRSHDGGLTWDAPVVAVSRERVGDLCPSPDKEWMERDAVTGTLHLVWTDFVFECEQLADDPLGVFGLLSYYDASIKMVSSTDGGETWSAPVLIHDGYALGAVPGIAPDGTLHVAYWGASTLPQLGACPSVVSSAAAATFGDPRVFTSIFVSTSGDGGASWATREFPVCGNELYFVAGPGEFAASNPSIAVDPTNGDVYVVYPHIDAAQAGRHTMMLTVSRDGGATWSAPADVTPYAGEDVHLPALFLRDDGVLRLAYVITRPADDTGDAAYTESRDGGATWTQRTILTSERWDLAADQELGHYIDIDVVGDRIAVIWTDARNGDWSGTEIWARVGTVG